MTLFLSRDSPMIITEEYLVCNELDLEPLDEAGGLISWLKRTFSGVDNSIAEHIERDLHKIKTREERDALLHELDGYIREAENTKRDGTFGDLLAALGLGSISGLMGAAVGGITGAVQANKLAKPVVKANWLSKLPVFSKLHQMKVQSAEALHKAQQFGTIVDRTTRGLAMAGLAASLVAFSFRTVNRYSGRMDDYINSLRVLRSQVASYQVPAPEHDVHQ